MRLDTSTSGPSAARAWTTAPRTLTLAVMLPWASYLQTPADIWLGKDAGTEILAALGVQALWVVLLLIACHALLGAATRKVVVQGG